jgi:glycyl-tRNA synthetase (class II)
LHLHPDLAPVKVAVIPLAEQAGHGQLAKRIKKGLQVDGQLDLSSTTAAISESVMPGKTRSARRFA